MQRQRQPGPWAQSLRGEAQGASWFIAEETFHAGAFVGGVKERFQHFTSIVQIVGVQSRAFATSLGHDGAFLLEHAFQRFWWAMLMNVGHAIDRSEHGLSGTAGAGRFAGPENTKKPEVFEPARQ